MTTDTETPQQVYVVSEKHGFVAFIAGPAAEAVATLIVTHLGDGVCLHTYELRED